MPIRFDADPRPEVFQVVQFHVEEPIHLIPGSDVSFQRSHVLHWLSAEKRTVPCTHEDCPWCPLPSRQAVYVPALVYSTGSRCWKQKILCLTQQMHPFLKENYAGSVWIFSRSKRHNGPVVWRRAENLANPQPFAGFDVVPSLLRMWGMWGKTRRTANRPDAELALNYQGEGPK